MKHRIKRFFEAIISPFVSVSVMIDESKRINEDGSWDAYWAKKNARAMKREERKARKQRNA